MGEPKFLESLDQEVQRKVLPLVGDADPLNCLGTRLVVCIGLDDQLAERAIGTPPCKKRPERHDAVQQECVIPHGKQELVAEVCWAIHHWSCRYHQCRSADKPP
jgi:hypothetical protein